MNNYQPCRKCKGEKYIYSTDKNGQEVAIPCECYKDFLNSERLKLYLQKANIPSSVLDYDVNTYIGTRSENNVIKLKKFINEFTEKYYKIHLFLYGTSGTQKTTLSYWIGRELIKQNKAVQYVYMNELIKLLQNETFDESSQDVIIKYYNCDCLIVDRAFSKDQITLYKSGYQISFIDTFLRKRMEQLNKSIIFVSNIKINEISKNGFPYDMEDLIKRNTIQTQLFFEDHYTLKDDFPSVWE